MRRLVPALCAGLLSACTCGTHARDKVYACTAPEDCAPDFDCVNFVCVPTSGPGGGAGGGGGGGGAGGGTETCVPGNPRICAVSACEQVCEPSGNGYGPCLPTSGADITRNREHCGGCGIACSNAYGSVLDCIASHCACATNADCPAGQACSQSGLCVDATDACASSRCDAGTVCRNGGCAVSACEQGCQSGEVCELSTGLCRFIDTCKLPVECPVDGGVCEGATKPDGTPCADPDPCTSGDVCMAGACMGTPYSCSGTPGVCQQAIGCAGDGGCQGVPAVDGTPCDDGVVCTHTDGCLKGACTGTSYVCAPGVCATASACAGDGGCLTTPQNEGMVCDDGNLCSVNDVCVQGACTGATYTCPMPAPCDETVACTGDGGCLVMRKPNGAACEDGQVCTTSDTCQNGTCMGGATGTTYRDLDGDGRGDSNISAMTCPAPAGYVAVGGDCNDSDPDIFTFVQDLVRDLDRDGRTTGVAAGQCVGDTMMVSGRTAYRDLNGNYTWLTSALSLGADCDDADPDIYTSLANAVTDADHDGYYSGTPGTVCAGASSTVNGRTYSAGASGMATYLVATDALGSTECNDSNPNIYRTVTAALDADQDGYVVMGTAGSQCLGASAMVTGRTYYASSTGTLSWLFDTPLGPDCNDANAAVSGPFPWYYDFDRDTYGGTSSMVACAVPDAGFVTVSGDCDDMNVSIFRTGISVVPDDDRDGYKNGGSTPSSTACIGTQTTFSSRTYYRNAAGADTWLASAMSVGDDCSNANANLFASMPSMVIDADHDGYYLANPTTACVGVSVVANGRTYYRDAAGNAIYLASTAALGSTECNDADPDIFRTINAGTDVDQDGYIVTMSTAMQCLGATSTIAGRTYYADQSAAFTRLGSPPLGDDCNDMNPAVSGPFPWYFDMDGDGTGGATTMTSCTMPAPGYVVNGNDCDDVNPNIYRIITVGLVPDGDRDGYKLLGSVTDTSECVGASSTVGTRTYYRNAAGGDFWLTASQSLGDDCNDTSAAVLGPPTWYPDTDGDTYGAGVPTVQCMAPASGYVTNNTDCNDNLASGGQYVYRSVLALYDDSDRDGYSDSGQGFGTRCVGLNMTYLGRTYYRGTSGNYNWTPANLGTDCNDNNANVFTVQNGLLNDDDNDGYPYPNDVEFSQCAGASSLIAGRQYWVGPSGTPDFLLGIDCLGRQGNSCRDIDCYDQNANARPGQTNYYGTHRGDGSFDYDCSGAALPNPSTGTYCATVSSQTFYTDAACTLGATTNNLCLTPTMYFGGSVACGKYQLSTSAYYGNVAACALGPRASPTPIGCH